MSLTAELPQVMVGVQVAPPHPIRVRHRAKESMINSQLLGHAEPIHFSKGLSKVLLKYSGTHPGSALFQGWNGPETWFPRGWLPERNIFQSRCGYGGSEWRRFDLARGGQKCAPYMADHLCC